MTPPLRYDIFSASIEPKMVNRMLKTNIFKIYSARRGHNPALHRTIEQVDKLKFDQ